MTDTSARVGDELRIKAQVLECRPGWGFLIELYGPSSMEKVWVRPEHITDVVPAGTGVPPELPDGTLLVSDIRAWRRNDAEGHDDEAGVPNPSRSARRFDRHWWDYEYQDWVDWPTVVSRAGGDLESADMYFRTIDRPWDGAS